MPSRKAPPAVFRDVRALRDKAAGLPWADLVGECAGDARLADGLGELLFAGEPLPAPVLAAVLPAAADRALRHADPARRWQMFAVLYRTPGEPALGLLRAALAGAFAAPVPPPALDEDNDGYAASVPALAALALGLRGDTASLPEIERLAAASQGRDRKILERAAQRLAGK